MFHIRSELSITAYLLLVLYRSTSLQSLSFLKNIETFMWKQKLMNNCSIPSKQQPYNHDRFSKISGASTTVQSQSFLKTIKTYLGKQKTLNDCSIPSMHAERKITICSHKHSFTPYPSLSPYSRMDRMTDRGTNTLAARGLEELFFQFCCCVSFWLWRDIGLGFTYLCTQSTIQLWCCVSFLVLA